MNINKIIIESVYEMLKSSSSEEKLKKLYVKHDQKSHFVPYKYRIFGGVLQSLNIKFGNFIETFVKNIVLNDKDLILLEDCGKKDIKFSINSNTDRMIDEYISKRQQQMSVRAFEVDFLNLLDNIFDSETNNKSNDLIIKHDIDMLFKDKNGVIHYIEFKYTDDHDTEKFVDINRKFLKTYAGLINHLNIKNKKDLFPSIYYFNKIIKKFNFFVYEDTHILRGSAMFEKFLNIKYEEVDNSLKNVSENPEVVKLFDDLYNKIRYDK